MEHFQKLALVFYSESNGFQVKFYPHAICHKNCNGTENILYLHAMYYL